MAYAPVKDAGLFLREVGPFEIGFRSDLPAIFLHSRSSILGCELIDQWMLRREHHVGRAVKRVRSRGEDADLVAAIGDRGAGVIDSGYSKINLRAFAATDPVALQQLDRLRPIEAIKLADQTIGKGR